MLVSIWSNHADNSNSYNNTTFIKVCILANIHSIVIMQAIIHCQNLPQWACYRLPSQIEIIALDRNSHYHLCTPCMWLPHNTSVTFIYQRVYIKGYDLLNMGKPLI